MTDYKLRVSPEVQKDIYRDLLQGPLSELGSLATDCVKAIRYFLPNVQYFAMKQEQVAKELNELRDAIPAELQTQPPPEIAAPVLDRLFLLEDTNRVRELYKRLLRAASDTSQANKVHPAFLDVLERISSSDALLLSYIWDSYVAGSHADLCLDWDDQTQTILVANGASPRRSVAIPIGYDSAQVTMEILRTGAIIENVGGTNYGRRIITLDIRLTKFGEMFCTACVPSPTGD